MAEEDVTAGHMGRTVQFLAKTSLSWQIWKETEPELFWLFERTFRAWRCVVKFTGDEHSYLLEIELPQDQAARVEKAIRDGSLAIELDKIHGIDPVLHRGRKDVKLSKFQVSLAPAQPVNLESRKTIESLESRLLELELNERVRSIDLRVVMRDLQSFQIDMYKRFEDLEKRVEDGLVSLGAKCDKMEKAVAKYKPGMN
ncbi:hypothetical protein HK105_200761 [Polyrhizophydium stewartii]|uniref:Uncharacterized protein n=1 Tax=Polyrhizophydium stewartii TaxID=2732419 RepID=A0ABR4NK57_9FUNG|nr:hypothetical protein HK105_004312 [Polyrhizophydium stewartii]